MNNQLPLYYFPLELRRSSALKRQHQSWGSRLYLLSNFLWFSSSETFT